MNKLNLIWIFAFVFIALSMNVSASIINNTFDNTTGTPATAGSDWSRARLGLGGCGRVMGSLVARCDNQSSTGGAAIIYNKSSDARLRGDFSIDQINITDILSGGGGGGENKYIVYTGGLSQTFESSGGGSAGSMLNLRITPISLAGESNFFCGFTTTLNGFVADEFNGFGTPGGTTWQTWDGATGTDSGWIIQDGIPVNMTFIQNSTTIRATMCINASACVTYTGASTLNLKNASCFVQTGGGSDSGDKLVIDGFTISNQTGSPQYSAPPPILDTTPPSITLINLTSEGGKGQIIYTNQSLDGYITHKQNEPANLPNYARNFDGINMNGNVLLLHFDNNDTADYSNNGNSFTAFNGANVTNEGKIREGYRFNDSQYLNVSDQSELSFTGASPTFAFAFWVNYNGVSGGGTAGTGGGAISKAAGGGQWEYSIEASASSGGQLILQTWTSGGGSGPFTAFSAGNAPHSIDGWHYMVISADGTNARGYVDGVLKWTVDKVAAQMSDTNEDFVIGVASSPRTNFFNGTIDEVSVFNRDITQAEIIRMYQQGLGKVWRTNDTTPTFFAITDESATCAVIDKDRNLNWTDIFAGNANSDTEGTTHTLTLNLTNQTGRVNLHNFSIGCKDSSGNENSTSTSGKFIINITDTTPPNATIFKPNNGSVYRIGVNLTLSSTIIQFNWSATDNYDTTLKNCSIYFNGELRHNVTDYKNNTIVSSNMTLNSEGNDMQWYVNCTDQANNINQSQIFLFTILSQQFNVNITLYLNDSHANRSYEFNTTLLDKDYGVRINMTVTPNTTICIDYDYLINWTCLPGNSTLLFNITELNITKLNNGSNFANITGTIINLTFKIDNNTDLEKIGFRIRGFNNNGYPANLTIDIDGDLIPDIIIPGYIKENEIMINEFKTSSGPNQRSANITFSSGGSITIQINASSSIKNIKNFTGYIDGYNIDPVAYNIYENFTSSIRIASTNLSAPYGVYDDYERNSSSLITIVDVAQCDEIQSLTSGDDYLQIKSLEPDANNRCTITLSDLDIKKYQNVTLLHRVTSGTDVGNEDAFWYITDGTNSVTLNILDGPLLPGFNYFDLKWHIARLSPTLWNWAYNKTETSGSFGPTLSGQADLSSLDISKKWSIKITTSRAIPHRIYNVNVTGAYLPRNGSGEYKNYSVGVLNFTTVVNASAPIIRAAINATFYQPPNTKIRFYLRNNNISAFDEVSPTSSTNPVLNVLTMSGNNLTGYVTMTTNDTTATPELYDMRFIISPGTATNVSVDCGNDGDADWNYDGVLNSTRQINCSVADFDTYRTNNCLNTKTCNYPVSLSVGSSGQIGINSINFTQSLEAKPNITSEITISNLTRYENMSLFNFTLRKVIDGVVNLYGFDFEFKGSKNITLFAHSQENDTNLLGTSNLTLSVFYSKFNSSFQKGINYYDVFPKTKDSKNITPFGQTIKTPIWNITNLAYDNDFDVYVRQNETMNCTKGNEGGINVTYSNSSDKNDGIIINQSFKLILTNISKGEYQKEKINQTISITLNSTDGVNSTILNVKIIDEHFTLRNATKPFILLNRNIDYKVNFTLGNITLINSTFNNTNIFASYNYTIITPWKGVWNYWDLTNCTKRFIIPETEWKTYCQKCVR